MKTILVVTAIVFLGAIGIASAVLNYRTPPTTDVILLRDVTEPFIAKPDASEILKLFNLSENNRWNGASFQFSSVTDISYNRIIETSVEPVNKWFSNELERDREVKAFQDSVTGIMTEAAKDTIGKWHSSIYFSMAERLTYLNRSNAEKKILLLYSDLMENSNGISFYNDKLFSLLKTNSDSVRVLLEKRKPLPALDGIEVYLIYQPSSAEDDSRYKVVSEFYRHMLESNGATVHLSANLLTH